MDKIQVLFSKLIYSELSDFFKELDSVEYAVIKGEPLSLQAYGELSARHSTDVDILIDKSNLRTVKEMLERSGFFCKTLSRRDKIIASVYSHQTPPFVKKDTIATFTVDVNHSLFWGEYAGKKVSLHDFLQDTLTLDIYGVKVKTLPKLKAMIQLVLHHYKEMNSLYHLATHNCINYEMFKDVYFLWRNNQTEITQDKLLSISNEYGILPYVYYIFYFTSMVFRDSQLNNLVDLIWCEEGEKLINCYGLTERERKVWRCNFETRLSEENKFLLIKDDILREDIEKIERGRRIFGVAGFTDLTGPTIH